MRGFMLVVVLVVLSFVTGHVRSQPYETVEMTEKELLIDVKNYQGQLRRLLEEQKNDLLNIEAEFLKTLDSRAGEDVLKTLKSEVKASLHQHRKSFDDRVMNLAEELAEHNGKLEEVVKKANAKVDRIKELETLFDNGVDERVKNLENLQKQKEQFTQEIRQLFSGIKVHLQEHFLIDQAATAETGDTNKVMNDAIEESLGADREQKIFLEQLQVEMSSIASSVVGNSSFRMAVIFGSFQVIFFLLVLYWKRVT